LIFDCCFSIFGRARRGGGARFFHRKGTEVSEARGGIRIKIKIKIRIKIRNGMGIEDGADGDFCEKLVFAGVHAFGLSGSGVVVALDVEEGVEGVEEEFVVEGVVEFFGTAAGFVEADNGVEVDGVLRLET
jgi:hypothetical protein